MIRMLMVGYCMGIRSERRLCEEVHLNLACRWFCRARTDGKAEALIPQRLPQASIKVLAAREHKSERSIRMTLSLAFVAPPIVAAAIEGRLPRGFGSKRLMDLPMVWSHQWNALGLKAPART
jgi:hypothetical protein